MTGAGARRDAEELLERKARLTSSIAARPELTARLRALRAWQAGRLARTYEDLRADPRNGRAMDFFLSDVYGPQDFTGRDAQLMRAWSALHRTLPSVTLKILTRAIELQVLSEELDLEVAQHLPAGEITAESYARAYRAAGRPEARRHQIELIVDIGERLARAVHVPLVGLALRAARAPARIAGFGLLQDFLERGFAAFAHMSSAAPLLTAIGDRERKFMTSLLANTSGDSAAAGNGAVR